MEKNEKIGKRDILKRVVESLKRVGLSIFQRGRKEPGIGRVKGWINNVGKMLIVSSVGKDTLNGLRFSEFLN